MADWVRRVYASAGLTQGPPGPHLRTLQGRFGGVALLMIDVSGSMDGLPLHEAVRGATRFVEEAVAAHYRIGLLLWNTSVVASAPPTLDAAPCHRVLSGASAWGGTSLLDPLYRAHRMLEEETGDRVVAIFGDGDLGPRSAVLEKVAAMKADDIRFVTRGLGARAAGEFAEISDEADEAIEVKTVSELASGIAAMAQSLQAKGGR